MTAQEPDDGRDYRTCTEHLDSVNVRIEGEEDFSVQPARSGGGQTVQPNADRIIRLRDEKGWSSADLAAELGCDVTTVEQIEAAYPTSPENIYLLAELFEVDPNELLSPKSSDRQREIAIEDKSLGSKTGRAKNIVDPDPEIGKYLAASAELLTPDEAAEEERLVGRHVARRKADAKIVADADDYEALEKILKAKSIDGKSVVMGFFHDPSVIFVD